MRKRAARRSNSNSMRLERCSGRRASRRSQMQVAAECGEPGEQPSDVASHSYLVSNHSVDDVVADTREEVLHIQRHNTRLPEVLRCIRSRTPSSNRTVYCLGHFEFVQDETLDSTPDFHELGVWDPQVSHIVSRLLIDTHMPFMTVNATI